MLVLATVAALASGESFLLTLGLTALAVSIVVAIDAITATVSRLLPKKCANHEKKIFRVSAKEKKFYEKLKIRKWKDRVPEIGQFTGFRKNKLVDPKSVEYLDRFLLEACYGEIGHFFSCIFGFLTLAFFFVSPLWQAIAIPVCTVNVFMNLPSLFILRYNSYKLEILRTSNLKKQARAQAEGEILQEVAATQIGTQD